MECCSAATAFDVLTKLFRSPRLRTPFTLHQSAIEPGRPHQFAPAAVQGVSTSKAVAALQHSMETINSSDSAQINIDLRPRLGYNPGSIISFVKARDYAA